MSENVNITTGEIVVASDRNIGTEISSIGTENAGFYTSIKGTDMDARLEVATAMSNAVSLSEHLKKPLNIVNIIIQEVALTNEETGKTDLAPRTTLIDADGTAYSATSMGIFSSVKQLLAVVGEPEHWSKPVALWATEEGVKPKRYMTLKFGTPSK